MSGDLDDLARAAADVLVSAMVSDSWAVVKRRFAALVGHERRMDAAREELAAASGPDRDRVRLTQERAWSTRLRDVLDDSPGAAEGLRALLTDLGTTPPAVTPTSQHARADHGSQAVNVGGSIRGNTGEIYVGVGKVDKRKINVALAPLVFLLRVTKKMAAAHPAATAASAAVMLTAVAVTGWQAHWPRTVFGRTAADTLTWTAAEAPLPPDAVQTAKQQVSVNDVACPAAHNCMAVGEYGSRDPGKGNLAETLRQGTWTPAAALGSGRSSGIFGVACPAVGTCLAVGYYLDSHSYVGPLAQMLTNGTWTQVRLPLPAGASRQPQNVGLWKVSCPASGACVAVGGYVAPDGTTQGLVETLSNGTWTAARAPLPADAAAGGTSPGNPTALYGVTCPAAGTCVAAGQYQEQDGNTGGVIDTLSNGVWTAAKAPVPAGGTAKPGSWLRGITCPVPGACVAVGTYTGQNGKEQGLIDTLSGGSWAPATAPLPANSAAGKGWSASLMATACTSAGACVVIGDYGARNGADEGLIATLSSGTWTPVMAPLPPDAAVAKQSGVDFSAVACPAVGDCVVVGSYIAKSGTFYGLIESGHELRPPAGG